MERDIAPTGSLYLFCGVNPSTADHSVDDATSRKWVGFVSRWRGRGYLAVNPFAYRATDVNELARAADPIGPGNDDEILEAIARADVLVPCWGSRAKLPPSLRPRLDEIAAWMVLSGKPLFTFGRTASGDPKHPLMLGYDTELEPW